MRPLVRHEHPVSPVFILVDFTGLFYLPYSQHSPFEKRRAERSYVGVDRYFVFMVWKRFCLRAGALQWCSSTAGIRVSLWILTPRDPPDKKKKFPVLTENRVCSAENTSERALI